MELIEDCVHCGFCLPTCPTYALWGEEMDSPRGRIYLMKMGLEGRTGMTDTYVRHFDRCLGCMACVTACPSGVQYDRLIEAARAQIERRYRRPLPDRLFRWALFRLFPYPRRVAVLALFVWFYQASRLRQLARQAGIIQRIPQRLQALESLAPPLSLRTLTMRMRVPAHMRAVGPARLRVGLVTGCVQRVFFPQVNLATMRVLAAEGCEVLAPSSQCCCGALALHAGREADALDFARRTVDLWARLDVDAVIINAAGCGSVMKEYGRLLRHDPRYAAQAEAFSARCRDVSELLAGLEPRAPRHPLPLRVAYHDACHLQHAQGISAEPRRLLTGIPGLELVEVPEPAICCGSAGIYNLVEPDAAQQLGERKARNILQTGAQVVASGNPGCLLQIHSHLHRAGSSIPVVHTIQLLDASITGVLPPAWAPRSGRVAAGWVAGGSGPATRHG